MASNTDEPKSFYQKSYLGIHFLIWVLIVVLIVTLMLYCGCSSEPPKTYQAIGGFSPISSEDLGSSFSFLRNR